MKSVNQIEPDPSDDLSLEEMTNEQLEMETADLRSGIEAITLDLLDDAKGDFYRGDEWRKRARGALAYKRADLNAANALLKTRQQARETTAKKEAAIRQERAVAVALAQRVKFKQHISEKNMQAQLEISRIKVAQDQEKTERHRIDTEAMKTKERLIIKAFQSHYGMDAYLDLIEKAGIHIARP